MGGRTVLLLRQRAGSSWWSNPSGKVDTTWHHKYPPTDIDFSWPFQIRSNKGLEWLEDYSSLGGWAALMRGIARPRIDSPWPFSGTPKWTNPLYQENLLFHHGFFRALARLPGGVARVEGCADSLPSFPIPAQLDPTSGVRKHLATANLGQPYSLNGDWDQWWHCSPANLVVTAGLLRMKVGFPFCVIYSIIIF